ncbi:MAG TPA: dTDP-4-dehydrorhamnose reductase [Acidobacteriaceae bacterium]|jgi:dTDP-4-dehydrorhamnose reductase|nr:dTDP-4-dehydrorhamnose reductase [Acidobacteriaceae bacterium]
MPSTQQDLRILVTGRDGQVGYELQRALVSLGEVIAVSRKEMDLASADSICNCIRSVRPKLIVNAAAYTAVDKAESEPERAQQINADAVAILAEEAKNLGAAVIHYSTDYVFDGAKATPYAEEDPTNPLNVYGATKLGGEQALAEADIPYLVLRTSWVYGARGKNFLRTILKLAAEKPELRIVDDQTGAPTWARDIAAATASIARFWFKSTGKPRSPEQLLARAGVYHLTASGETTWHGFAAEAIRVRMQLFPEEGVHFAHLAAIPTSEYPTPAARPRNSRLDCSKAARAFDIRLPEWSGVLTAVLKEMG